MEVCCIRTHEDNVIKLTKLFERKGRERGGEYNGEDELIQGTLYTSV
jgi:hypothetical protein